MESTERSTRCIPTSTSRLPRRESRTTGRPPNAGDSGRTASGLGAALRASGPSRDTSDMRARLTSTHFVGRVGELAELELALREVAARRPALVLLGGDSGVGKTRLVTEFERRVTGESAAL